MTSVEFRGISPGFLDAFAIPLRAGRDVAADDRAGGAGVVLVNEAFVRAHLDADGAAGPAGVLDRLLEVPDPASGALLIFGAPGTRYQLHGEFQP